MSQRRLKNIIQVEVDHLWRRFAFHVVEIFTGSQKLVQIKKQVIYFNFHRK